MKPRVLTEVMDMLGNPIRVGTLVAYPTRRGSETSMRIGKVTSLGHDPVQFGPDPDDYEFQEYLTVETDAWLPPSRERGYWSVEKTLVSRKLTATDRILALPRKYEKAWKDGIEA